MPINLDATINVIMAWLIVGLGNPGSDYDQTRHNTGRLLLEAFQKKAARDYDFSDWKKDLKTTALKSTGKIGGSSLQLLLPEGFMNNSGKSLKPLITSVKQAEKLVVIHDDLDLPLGSLKIVFNRGAGGHRGIESIIKNIKTEKFVRIKIGISPHTPGGKIRKPAAGEKVLDFILGKFKAPDLEILKKMNKTVTEIIYSLVGEGLERTMNEFN